MNMPSSRLCGTLQDWQSCSRRLCVVSAPKESGSRAFTMSLSASVPNCYWTNCGLASLLPPRAHGTSPLFTVQSGIVLGKDMMAMLN